MKKVLYSVKMLYDMYNDTKMVNVLKRHIFNIFWKLNIQPNIQVYELLGKKQSY